MGCSASAPNKALSSHPPLVSMPETAISSERKQEADDHFGLTTHIVGRPLGKGGVGETFLTVRTTTREKEAVKVIRRPIPKILQNLIVNEILIQAQLGEGHFNIVNAHNVSLTSTHLCLMLEYAAGGTLTDNVSDRYDTAHTRGGLFMSEGEACYYFQQCISAIEYCHNHGVAHRDLKLDNILLDTHDPPYIKICDFGFSRMLGSDNCHTRLGTPEYAAPQMIEHKARGYDGRASDVWALGVLLFVMLLGMFPFENDLETDAESAFQKVLDEQTRTVWTENPNNKGVVSALSPSCRDLLDRIFTVDEAKRITMSGIKAHEWYNQQLQEPYASAKAKLAERQRRIQAAAQSVPV